MPSKSEPAAHSPPVDEDLAAQAVPGHGIPSQDPSAAAQRPLDPVEAKREANSVLVGGGMVAGVVAGAAIGTAMAGPVGAVVGGTAGAVAGALGGAAAGPLANADEPAPEPRESRAPRAPREP